MRKLAWPRGAATGPRPRSAPPPRGPSWPRETTSQQQQFLPYLTGYLAFYAEDYKTAIAEFQKGNLNDAFVVGMIAQAYEKLGDKSEAMDHYQAALSFTSHNPPVAYARPLARKKLGR